MLRFLFAFLLASFRFLGLLALLLITQPAPVKAAALQPMQAVGSCVVTVTTTGTKVSALMVTAGCYASEAVVPTAGVLLANSTTTVICLGDSNVNMTRTAGGRCSDLCSGCTLGTTLPAFVTPGGIYAIVASSTQIMTVMVGQ